LIIISGGHAGAGRPEALGSREDKAIKTKHESPSTPQVAVGAIVIKEKKILLVKRNKEPGRKKWAIPGGCVKLGETLHEAAEREVREETGLKIKAKKPVYAFDLIEQDKLGRTRFHYVIIDIIADLMGGKLRPSDDAADAGWFSSEEIERVQVTQSTKEFLKKLRFIP
jgi:ADP-ribose pyrophosphatase